jgi:CRISPR-associated protein Cas2
MALNEIRTWLIAYDITCPRRLARVHRYLKTVAVPVQYSVFAAEETSQGIQRIRDALAQEINSKTDDVRIYPLPNNLELHHYGRHSLPEGLQLLADKNHRSTGPLVSNPPGRSS